MKNPILPNIFDKHNALRKERIPLDCQLIDRLDYIFRTVGNVCEFSFDSWSEGDGSGSTYGYVWDIFKNNSIEMSRIYFAGLILSKNSDDKIVIKGKTIHVRDTLPKRWLFSPFEKELEDGARLYRTKRAVMIDRAKARLSLKELKVLGLSQ